MIRVDETMFLVLKWSLQLHLQQTYKEFKHHTIYSGTSDSSSWQIKSLQLLG